MGKQRVRCPRDERVARPSAMIHLLPVTPWIMAVFVCHVSMIPAAPPISVTVRHFEDLSALFELGEGVKALPQTPELLTLLELKADPKVGDVKTIVYQEPPLGEHLLDVLRRFAPDMTVTTPVLLLTSKGRPAGEARPLAGKTIGLSLGKDPDLDRLGFHQAHVEDPSIEFARYLFEAGATLAYGGTLKAGGFTEILRDLLWTYDASDAITPRLL